MSTDGRRSATWLYLLLTAALAAWLFASEIHVHGRTLDDKVQRARGESTLAYVTSLDETWLPPADLENFEHGDRLYGPFGAATAVLLGRLIAPVIGDVAAEPHLQFSCGLTCWFLLLFYCTLVLGERFTGRVFGGICCGLALIAMPRVIGLATCNPSDLPAAGAAAGAVWMLLRWIDAPRWGRAVATSIGLAAAAAVRPQNGALLLPVAAAFLIPHYVKTRSQPPWRQLAAAPFMTFGFWVLFWPDFWHAPIGGPLSVVSGFLEQGNRYTQGTLWFGKRAHGPYLYPIVWLAITTPLVLLLGAMVGVLRAWRRPLAIGLLAWTAISIGKHLSGLGNFGGIRHFLDAFVPIALFAVAGLGSLLSRLPRRIADGALFCGLAAMFAVLGVRESPYQSSWFNALAGGTSGAAGRFDLEPNGSSMLVLMRSLVPSLDKDSVVLVPGPADLVRQVPLPTQLVVEVLPATIDTLASGPGREMLRGRRVFLVTVQDRGWGLFDDLAGAGLLEEVARSGPDGLPVGLAFRVEDEAVYERLGELYR